MPNEDSLASMRKVYELIGRPLEDTSATKFKLPSN
jgi:hypothetical protein